MLKKLKIIRPRKNTFKWKLLKLKMYERTCIFIFCLNQLTILNFVHIFLINLISTLEVNFASHTFCLINKYVLEFFFCLNYFKNIYYFGFIIINYTTFHVDIKLSLIISSKTKVKNVHCSIVCVQIYSYYPSLINMIVRKHIFLFLTNL